MKKVFPFALLSCLILSFSGLNAANSHSVKAPLKQEAAKPFAYETDGVLTGSPYGNISWHIFYIGTAPQTITYTNNGTTYGPYTFSGGQAGGPRTQLGIIYVEVVNGTPNFVTIW
ncbi:hypothetical protein [Chitinophaga filiformis]|uniref:Uncharacterized protein n=1 Tax=Chitinophaga filiformis TaxID=104663 RepID=A0A1G8B3W5_CHIFI|nr:hypothetical protein [Chitinophaga filiformis]SDH27887.1 hypothetical protein SAMN04488121_110111 [Chitinophaga filiformis]